MKITAICVTGLLAFAVAGCATDDNGAPPPGPAYASPVGSASLGGNLVRQKCAGCHAVESTGESPMKAAPPFREMGRTYPVRDLQEALAEGLVTAHPAMPQIELEANEVANIIVYLESVSGTGGGGAN
ncbi:MAG: c-type cytochrome [Brevundimonas sp.]|uniref:c-type cytochrome n=1 Tax=Brevundimonas sp. TaxID=1871086 RepID=UPI00391CBFC5